MTSPSLHTAKPIWYTDFGEVIGRLWIAPKRNSRRPLRTVPGDQGFDEWFGIPNSSDEAYWPDSSLYQPDSDPFAGPAYVMENVKGEFPKKLKIYDLAQRGLALGDVHGYTAHSQRRAAPVELNFSSSSDLAPHRPMAPRDTQRGRRHRLGGSASPPAASSRGRRDVTCGGISRG
jgi:hypothetical protein